MFSLMKISSMVKHFNTITNVIGIDNNFESRWHHFVNATISSNRLLANLIVNNLTWVLFSHIFFNNEFRS